MKKVGPDSFHGTPAQGQDKGQKHIQKLMKFHMNMRKNVFILRVTEHWNRLPIEVVESSLEIFKQAWM